ncbi:MAG: TonB-dependent receptor [Flavobacteriales bacterium]|nr:TonB-dependent receptor [Flavobacteriales bacterium]|tara:strand:- start:9628 stop:11925 length:2298 start_codon:yes stop_codon:yes gene_type:complete
MKKIILFQFCLLIISPSISQTLIGKIYSENQNVPYANIILEGTSLGTSSNHNGFYKITDLPLGEQTLIVSSIGMVDEKIYVKVKKGLNEIDIELHPSIYNLDQIVVTGTKTLKKKTKSAVMVNIINSKQLENINACTIADGLNFQSGVRLETDCQTCNYTQLRMNGLAGGYSQILINGKAIFSPLTSLYGLEQIPINMVDRIEIIKGGGSALYGSSAIGGTVNIITKKPINNGFYLGYMIGNINNQSTDEIINANTTVLSNNKNSGTTIFMNHRKRLIYDHNDDNFSEIPEIQGNSFGANFFISNSEKSKLEINIGNLYEYRYGGEITDGPPHLSMQAEERIQNVFLGDIDYQIYFNDFKSSVNTYLAAQHTDRKHFTGIRPELGTEDDIDYLSNPPYGKSINTTTQVGVQLNHNSSILFGNNTITLGYEYIIDDILDEIETYNFLIDQKVKNFGTFIQSDWNLTQRFNLLSGFRIDKHSLLNNYIISPRVSTLYTLNPNTQIRLSYSTGFRAPQAFDSDLHIAFSGGGVSMIQLSDNLKEEQSKSLSWSMNYNIATNKYFFGVTLEGFYTRLKNAFFLDPIGNDIYGDIFIKKNGDGATVRGLNIEIRSNLNKKIQFESGFTYQNSEYDSPVVYSLNLAEKNEFLRTPKLYGYSTIEYFINNKFNLMANLIHTGSMDIVHFAGAPNQNEDEYVETEVFNTLSIKAIYIQKIQTLGFSSEFSIGVHNLTNAYQQIFDTSKNRDSNFIYGPNSPRKIFISIKIKSL